MSLGQSRTTPARPRDLREGNFTGPNVVYIYAMNPDGSKGDLLRIEEHRPQRYDLVRGKIYGHNGKYDFPQSKNPRKRKPNAKGQLQ